MYLIKPRKLHVIGRDVPFCGRTQEKHRLQGDSSPRSQPVNHNVFKDRRDRQIKKARRNGKRQNWTDRVNEREIKAN